MTATALALDTAATPGILRLVAYLFYPSLCDIISSSSHDASHNTTLLNMVNYVASVFFKTIFKP